jgi:hypothetical protein
MSPAAAPLTSAREGGILTLTLDRPEKRNALSSALIDALRRALETADLDAGVRVVVLTGAGKDFCAGADLDELLASAGASPEANEASMARLLLPVTKSSRVTSASSASSTAYWTSGLSTIGSISFGMAFVAGRKRVPRPATGNTAVRTGLGMRTAPGNLTCGDPS